MDKDVGILVNSINLKLKQRLSDEKLKNNYIFNELERIILDWDSEVSIERKSDIGVAAIKIFDSGSLEDNELVNDICKLSEMYRKKF